MKLQLVTFEQAKALKALGFPQNDLKLLLDWYTGKIKDDSPSFPSLELAAKWLRDENNILIEITRVFGKYAGRIMELHISGERNTHIQFQDYSSYEEALSVGIDKAIEFLKGE